MNYVAVLEVNSSNIRRLHCVVRSLQHLVKTLHTELLAELG